MTENLLNENLLKTLGENHNSLKELNKRIENKTFKFDYTTTNKLYIYLYACNKFDELDTLGKLIKDKKFIELLDKSDITGSMIISLTNVFQDNRMTLLTTSKKIKESILNGDELFNKENILDDLTTKEMKKLREDIDIDNDLITSGLRFDSLKEDTKNQILRDYSLLSVYNSRVIVEFTNSLDKELKFLANDKSYLDLYIHALDDNYLKEDKIFEYITKDTLDYLLSIHLPYEVIYHLVKSTKGKMKEELLKDKRVLELLNVCQDELVLETLPEELKLQVLLNRTNLLEGTNSHILYSLSKKNITKLFEHQLYLEFIEALKEHKDINNKLLVNALPHNLLQDLIDNQLENLNNDAILELVKTNPSLLKDAILKNKKVCINFVSNLPKKDNTELLTLLELGKFNNNDKLKFVTNCETLRSSDELLVLISTVDINYRKNIYENSNIMSKIITNNNFILDEYTIPYLLSNEDELLKVKSNVLVELINVITLSEATRVLESDKVLEKLFSENKDNIAGMMSKVNKGELLSFFTKDNLIKYYNRDNIQNILDSLPLTEKKRIFVPKIQNIVFKDDEELIKVYKAIENKNSYLLNTLYLNFMNPLVKGVKISILERLTKNRELQEILFEIEEKNTLSINGIITVLNICDNLNTSDLINIAKVYRDSSIGINRKAIGNIPKMLSVVDKKSLNRKNIEKVISYILYLIPRYQEKKNDIKRPVLIKTPSTFNDIITYENRLEELASLNINKNDNILENFLIRHFKLTMKEAKIQIKRYHTNRIDEYIYREEIDYLSNLNKILNTDNESLKEMDYSYPTISMFDSYNIENKLLEMYGKIYNYELKTRSNTNKYRIERLYGKEIKIEETNNEFLMLINKTDITEELNKTNSYLEAWHNTLNNTNMKASLISNDNIRPFDDFYFGWNGVLEKGILNMSLHDIKDCCSCSSKIDFYHPFELIDNTRYDNTLILDKYALRPNYNNSNRPYVEPDFILINLSRVSDHTYLERVVRASNEFKTKRNKEGLPIIGIDFTKLIKTEQEKIEKSITRYEKTKDMITFRSILTNMENNASSYKDTEYEKEFKIKDVIELLKRRVPKSNSVKELEYLLDIFKEENNKFYNKDCNFDLDTIETIIKYRMNELNS